MTTLIRTCAAAVIVAAVAAAPDVWAQGLRPPTSPPPAAPASAPAQAPAAPAPSVPPSTGANASRAAAPSPAVASSADPDQYRIGPEDTLEISVWKNQDLSRTVVVRPDGRISLPLLNDLQAAGLTPLPSRCVRPPRVAECPVQLEAVLEGTHPLAAGDPDRRGKLVGIEVRIKKVHIEESLRMEGHENRIDPEKWRPLIMSFCQFFGLGPMVHPSRLAEIPESAYRPAPTPSLAAVGA